MKSSNSWSTADHDVPPEGFDSPVFLNRHVHAILGFYEGRSLDVEGGFFHAYRDDGTIYDHGARHLVSSTRFVFNYATAYQRYGNDHHRDWALHGLRFLQDRHRQPEGHFAWELNRDGVRDGRAMAYGHAFVILAASIAVTAGIEPAHRLIEEVTAFLDTNFWDAEGRAYADERDPTLKILDPYRGQNANMHLCEAFLAAWTATGEADYLDRADALARRFAGDLAALSDGLIWEHYTTSLQLDMDYNRDKPDDLFKPWGFQTGHQLEWAKLLLQLHDTRPDPWLVERAAALFQRAMASGWDHRYGGLVYGFAPDGSFADAHKYFWVHAEGFAAAWRLYRVTGEARYRADYQRIWEWSWRFLVDHRHGAWFRVRNRDGTPVDDLKSPPGKTDYHTLGACWDVLSQI